MLASVMISKKLFAILVAMKPPLYLINGPLGSGKTTLLKFLLSREEFANARIIENEFASTDIDATQLAQHQAEVRSISGLCVCCSNDKELTNTLEELAERSTDPVIVESSGVANSLVLIEKLAASRLLDYYDLRHAFFIIDAAEFSTRPNLFDQYREELAAADTVLISKTDLLEPEDTFELINRTTSLRSGPVESMHFGEFNFALDDQPSGIIDYYYAHQDATREHENDSSFIIITTSEHEIQPATVHEKWPHLVKAYGAERMKGAVRYNGEVWHVEATPSQCRITPSENPQEALSLVVIGSDAHHISETYLL